MSTSAGSLAPSGPAHHVWRVRATVATDGGHPGRGNEDHEDPHGCLRGPGADGGAARARDVLHRPGSRLLPMTRLRRGLPLTVVRWKRFASLDVAHEPPADVPRTSRRLASRVCSTSSGGTAVCRAFLTAVSRRTRDLDSAPRHHGAREVFLLPGPGDAAVAHGGRFLSLDRRDLQSWEPLPVVARRPPVAGGWR